MKQWVIYALISMVFAGLTSVIAKNGLAGISGELGVVTRTCFVFMFVVIFAAFAVPFGQWTALTRSHLTWLGLSALTTTISWVFYYKAIKDGEVSTVALIDKGSVVVAVALAYVVLKETITAKTILGGALMVIGLIVIAKK